MERDRVTMPHDFELLWIEGSGAIWVEAGKDAERTGYMRVRCYGAESGGCVGDVSLLPDIAERFWHTLTKRTGGEG